MAEVAAFEAIRFDPARFGGNISAVLAPPYDVLDEGDKQALLADSDRNIVAIDLPHVPPKSAGPPERYEQSAKLLEEWLADGTLIRESNPAVYVYHQEFEHGGRSFTRRMFIARVRLQPFSEGVILPHEQTFGGPKEDRLALMKATQCQLSPIFGLYSDPEDRIGSNFSSVVDDAPEACGTLDGVVNRMWVITDPGIIERVAAIMADKRVYIADGHHRYGTALMYRGFVASELGGALPDDHPSRFVMFVLASMDDPGCLILPYHRAIANVELKMLLSAWSPGTERTTADQADITVHDGQSGNETPLRFTNRAILSSLKPAQIDEWRELDYAYLHRYLIDELLSAALAGAKPDVRYVKSADNARQTASAEAGVALLMNATPMAHLRAVAEAGGLMPQKSTYFHPKLATGMTICPLG